MEIFELRYFMAVALRESVSRAAEDVHVSPGSLSKSVARLETELRTPLFFKSGRGIKLTTEGLLLKKRAAQLLQMEEDARFELAGESAGGLNVAISSEEVLQAFYGVELARNVAILFPQARAQFLIRPEGKAVEQVLDGEAHLALITTDPPSGVFSKVLANVEFRTCASPRHPLLKRFGAKRIIPVEAVLEHPFVAPDAAILGRIAKSSSADGWRDDKFPRRIKYKAYGLKLMENLVREGLALGYLPDYFVAAAGLVPLKISGCPYSCRQTVRLIVKAPVALGWLRKLWDAL
ncbi:MAG TPA: LysR family transcriptional regulator [Elusimicrobiota bacterium]|jgi:DNA-binding transcriptional LysR family regulator|nr:LysR family transcriptional regulator [Elusimicrobiota bacterium]